MALQMQVDSPVSPVAKTAAFVAAYAGVTLADPSLGASPGTIKVESKDGKLEGRAFADTEWPPAHARLSLGRTPRPLSGLVPLPPNSPPPLPPPPLSSMSPSVSPSPIPHRAPSRLIPRTVNSRV